MQTFDCQTFEIEAVLQYNLRDQHVGSMSLCVRLCVRVVESVEMCNRLEQLTQSTAQPRLDPD